MVAWCTCHNITVLWYKQGAVRVTILQYYGINKVLVALQCTYHSIRVFDRFKKQGVRITGAGGPVLERYGGHGVRINYSIYAVDRGTPMCDFNKAYTNTEGSWGCL